jgi:hypothetical protein
MTDLNETQATVTIRLLDGTAGDNRALRTLAERDGALLPIGPVLGAWEDGSLLAAVSLREEGSEVIADPFQHSAGAAALLASRMDQLRGRGRSRQRIRDRVITPRAAPLRLL